MSGSLIKLERHDEAEIQEMATKIVEANKAKMSNTAKTICRPTHPSGSLLNFLTRSNGKTAKPDTVNNSIENTKSIVDERSQKGQFGWTTLGKAHIPFIFRGDDKYCAVRMVEMKVLNKYLSFLHQDIYNCTCIRSYYISEPESRLLNEINFIHCDSQYGRDQFTGRDLIVRLSDAIEFYKFLDACYSKLLNGSSNPLDRCGFIRINKESVVPYTVYNEQKYVPLFYFEGETDNLKLKANKLEGWDLSYLKFCCKVQGIRNELFAHDSCSVISLNDIKNYFPPGTLFEDYWPNKMVDTQLLINGKVQTQIGQWTRQPSAPPMAVHPPPSPKPATQAKAAPNNQMHQFQPANYQYGMSGAQAPYPAPQPQPRPATQPVRSAYVSSPSTPRQNRSSYYVNMAQAPPPLIRAAQASASAYLNAQTAAAANYMLHGGGESTVDQIGYRQGSPQYSKYPPPLIPVGHLNGGMRYNSPQNHYPSADAVDLSTPTSNNSQSGHTIINQQPAHQQASHQQVHQQPPHSTSSMQEDRSMTNGRMTVNNLQRKLIPIPDPPTSGNHIPYKIQKALVEGKMVPCINMKPYIYTELLVTLNDLILNFFNNVPVPSCHQVMQVLGIELYKGNNSQMRVLLENGKCQNINEVVPMVQVRDVIDFMPQLKYMLGGLVSSEVASKRQLSS